MHFRFLCESHYERDDKETTIWRVYNIKLALREIGWGCY
jgi:hypothetical protein